MVYLEVIWVTAGRIKIECMFAPKRQTTDHDSLVPQHSPDKCHHELAQEKNSLWARPTRLLPTLRQGMPSSDTSTRAYLHVRRDSCLTAPMRGNDANPSESTPSESSLPDKKTNTRVSSLSLLGDNYYICPNYQQYSPRVP